MGPRRYFAAAGGVALLAGATGLTIWLTAGPDKPHGPVRVIKAAAPPLTRPTASPSGKASKHPAAKSSPGRTGLRPAIRKRLGTPPLSTVPPTGTGLGAPDHLTGVPRYGDVLLEWHPVAKAVGYVIYLDGTNIGQTTALSFDDTGLGNGRRHTWTVAALDSANVTGDRSAPYTAAAQAR
jgi:hypothetical protein